MRERLLVTGFGPFPGMPRNPSGEIARRVADSPRWRRLGIDARAIVLTTSYAALEVELAPLLQAQDFDALLMIGVSRRAKRVHIERRAANRASVLFADAGGDRPLRLTLAPGPGHRRSRVQADAVSVMLRRRALPCAASQSAGRYLCNAAYFSALAVGRPVLFLHIPKPPRPTRRSASTVRRKRMTWPDQTIDGFVDVALALLRQARRDRARIGGPGREVAASVRDR